MPLEGRVFDELCEPTRSNNLFINRPQVRGASVRLPNPENALTLSLARWRSSISFWYWLVSVPSLILAIACLSDIGGRIRFEQFV